jgi:casein kinase I family protein HRR25
MEVAINNKYSIIKKIGEGSFGSIYKGQNVRTHEYVAIKVEPIRKGTKLLKNESIIYNYLSNCSGIPSVKWFGKDSINYYMVINLLGESLQDLKNKNVSFTLKLTLQIGINILNLLKTIHSKGLVHRDIKPDNFLLGLNNKSRQIYIIDFGLCKSFIDKEKHIEMKLTHSLIGSKTYASINAHEYIELSRRDDLESLGYMMLYFYSGELAWQDLISVTNEDVKYMKKNLKLEGLPEVLVNYMKYIKSMEFVEKPNYSLIIDNFKRAIEDISSKTVKNI